MPREKKREPARTPINWRFWLTFSIWCVVFASSAIAAREMHHYALADPRFALSSEDPNALMLQGVKNASRANLLRVFSLDFGRSVFALSLAERRRRLLAVDWVEDASVSRVWPNRLLIRISERTPVAFAALPVRGGSGAPERFLLVDSQGVLLDPPSRGQFTFPVLNGLTEEQTEPERRIRVRAMMRLMKELGNENQKISEVDAASPDDLSVIAQVEGRGIELKLGDGNYARRLHSFLLHYAEIHHAAGDVNTFDLRRDDRITADEEQQEAQQ